MALKGKGWKIKSDIRAQGDFTQGVQFYFGEVPSI